MHALGTSRWSFGIRRPTRLWQWKKLVRELILSGRKAQGGRGRLETDGLVDMLQSFYGTDIRSHSCDLQDIWPTFGRSHCTSTQLDNLPRHVLPQPSEYSLEIGLAVKLKVARHTKGVLCVLRILWKAVRILNGVEHYFAGRGLLYREYILVQWNWFSGVTGCTWIPCIQWHRRTNFAAPGCRWFSALCNAVAGCLHRQVPMNSMLIMTSFQRTFSTSSGRPTSRSAWLKKLCSSDAWEGQLDGLAQNQKDAFNAMIWNMYPKQGSAGAGVVELWAHH